MADSSHNVTQYSDDSDRVIVSRTLDTLAENNVCVYADDGHLCYVDSQNPSNTVDI